MMLTRKQFLELSSRAAMGAAAYTAFPFVANPAYAQDVLNSDAVRRAHRYIAEHREEHIAKLQADLRQASVSSWNMGIREMADRMVESLRTLGCQEVKLIETKGFPGVWAYYDAGAPKTVATYMMYDTQPFEKERWTADPLAAERMPMDPFEEIILARGAFNSKGPNRFFLNACEAILASGGELPVNIMFTCDGEEEQGSPNFHEVLDPYRERLKTADAMLQAGPGQQSDGSVEMRLGTKGILYLELEVSGTEWGRGPQKMPIHSSRKAVLDSPVWRLVDALRSMYDPAENKILIDGWYDDIRPPNEEELMLYNELVTNHPERLFVSESENVKRWVDDWSDVEAARHLIFDTSFNIDGIWGGYTGPGSATILPERAAAKMDSRLVPDQEIVTQKQLFLDHLTQKGYGDIAVTQHGGGDEWSQTSVKAPVVQAMLSVYRHYGIEPAIWPRSPTSSPRWEFTRKLGLPDVRGGLGHGGRAHAVDEYIVIEGNEKVAGIVKAEQSLVDLLFAYASYPEEPRGSSA